MTAESKVLQSFITDALRLCARARECLIQLTEQADKNRVSPSQVRSLFQIIHTLKGTASMVPGGEAIVDALQMIEGKLACRSVVDSARNPEWLPEAVSALKDTHDVLLILQRKEKFPGPEIEPLVKGLLIRTVISDEEHLLWFPMSCVVRVLMPEELIGDSLMSVDGAWVPVIGAEASNTVNLHAPTPRLFGVIVRAQAGTLVVAAKEVLGVVAWSKAREQKAKAGLDIFVPGKLLKTA